MNRAGWKASERIIAGIVGGVRAPVSGRARGDVPDIWHPDYSIEVKSRSEVPAWLFTAMEQAEASMQNDHQLPIAIIHKAGARYADALVMMRLSDFVGWKGGS